MHAAFEPCTQGDAELDQFAYFFVQHSAPQGATRCNIGREIPQSFQAALRVQVPSSHWGVFVDFEPQPEPIRHDRTKNISTS